MENFFGDGLWRDQNLWPWNEEKVKQFRAVSVGSRYEPAPGELERNNQGGVGWQLLEQHQEWQDARIDEEINRQYPGDELDKKLGAVLKEYCRDSGDLDVCRRLSEEQLRGLAMQLLRRSIRPEIEIDFDTWRREFGPEASVGSQTATTRTEHSSEL